MSSHRLRAALAGLALASFAVSAIAVRAAPPDRRKPAPKAVEPPITVNQVRDPRRGDLTDTSRKQMVASTKAALERGKPVLRKERANLAASAKSEARNRKLRLAAETRTREAELAYNTTNTPANLARWQQSYAEMQPVAQAHESALRVYNSQKARVTQLEGFQTQALNAVRQVQQLTPVGAPAGAAPRFNRAANFVSPKSAYSVAPAPRDIYSGFPQPALASGAPRYAPGPLKPIVQNQYDDTSAVWAP